MRICIFTVYNSENCGSYWQARALQDYCKKKGHEVFFMFRDSKGTSHDKKKLIEYCIKACLKLRFTRIPRYIHKYASFESAISDFSVINEIDDSIDVCLFGSDTIWEITDEYFHEHQKEYWGGVSGNSARISYAPSVGNATREDFQDQKKLVGYLKQFSSISVRDQNSKECLEIISDIPVQVVCDPTWLFDMSYYNQFTKKPEYKPYLLVYCFGVLSKELQNEIHGYASKHGLRIVSFGESFDKCEKKLPFDPYLFVSYYRYADAVFTNTFHGTLFSVMFEKPFAVETRGKTKVLEVLEQIGASDRKYQNNKLEEVYCRPIDYTSLRKQLFILRKKSCEYLDNSIRRVYENN